MDKSPRTLNILLRKSQDIIEKAKTTAWNAQRREARLRRRVSDLLDDLKQKKLLNEEAERRLEAFSGNNQICKLDPYKYVKLSYEGIHCILNVLIT